MVFAIEFAVGPGAMQRTAIRSGLWKADHRFFVKNPPTNSNIQQQLHLFTFYSADVQPTAAGPPPTHVFGKRSYPQGSAPVANP
nr:hypothetical protein [uncultured Pseudomonas sp.]